MTLPVPAGKPFWSARKAIGLILVAVLVTGAALTGFIFYYHPLQSSTTPNTPDFKISTTSPQESPAGSIEKIRVGMTGLYGFSFEASYTLHAATGLSCSSSSSSSILTPTTTVDVSCSSDTRGVYQLTITLTSGSLSHSETVPFDFTPPSSITVKGRAIANFDTATNITFVKDGSSYDTPLLSNGNFSINLPNPGSYRVMVEKSMFGGPSASCFGGTLNLNQNSTGTVYAPYYICNLQYPTITDSSCAPTTVTVNITIVFCVATVQLASVAPVVPPSGTVYWTLSVPGFSLNPNNCVLTGGLGSGTFCNIMTQITSHEIPIPGQLTVFANYTGDSFHMGSEAHSNVTLQSPPLAVLVSGTATVSFLNSHAVGVEFVNAATMAISKASVSSGSYSLPLANQQSYKVTIEYLNTVTMVTNQCSAGTWMLASTTTTMTKNLQC